MTKFQEIHKAATEKALKALELRRSGMTFKEIGKHIGKDGPVCVERARQLFLKGERIEERRKSLSGQR